MITDFYVGTVGDAKDIISGETSLRPALSTGNADNSVLAELWAALDPEADVSSLAGEGCIVASGDGGPWVFELPKVLVAKLADLSDAAVPQVCNAWARGAEMSYHGVTGPDLAKPLGDLRDVARQVDAASNSMLLFMAI
jgi:hypothetical protein